MQHTKAFFLKTIGLSFLLFVESLVLTNQLLNFALSKNYFEVNWNFIILIGILLLTIAYTYSLTVGSWDTWLQFVVIPLPIALANALIVARINYIYALIAFFAIYLFTAYDVYFATQLKEQLIKFNPKIILRFSTKGILFIFAIMGGLLIFISPISPEDVNLTGFLADAAHEQANLLFRQTLDERNELRILGQMGLINLDFRNLIEAQLEQFIEPYRNFIIPAISLIVIGSIQFLNFIVFWVFMLTIDFIYLLAKRSKFINVEYRTVQQEVLTF